MDHGFDGMQQNATAQRMHGTGCVAQTLLHYFGSAHGLFSSGFATREERLHRACTVQSIARNVLIDEFGLWETSGAVCNFLAAFELDSSGTQIPRLMNQGSLK